MYSRLNCSASDAPRARKAGQKIPIAISANAGPYLMAAELLWLVVAADPTVGNLTADGDVYMYVQESIATACFEVTESTQRGDSGLMQVMQG